jgi:chemotaxis protein CheX
VEDEICQITESIWGSVLGVEIRRCELAEIPAKQEHTLAGCVQLTGAWEGAVALHCDVGLARQVAALMFSMDPGSASIEEVQDALGELVNMTGGNIKALLAEPCYLSLPTVVEGSNYTLRIPGSVLVSQVAFECQGHPFLVALLEKDEKQTEEG